MNKEDKEIIKELTLGFAEKMQEKEAYIEQLEIVLCHLIESIEKKYTGQAKINATNIAKQALQK